MPRIAAITLDQINRQFDTIDTLHKSIGILQQRLQNIGQSANIADPIHAPLTTNNLNFHWDGPSHTLSWAQGYIKDKNWAAQTVSILAPKSSAPGQQHIYTIPTGSLSLTASTYYWLGWDNQHQTMLATTDASQLHKSYEVHILCQIFTGGAGDTGSAGGGGSTGGVDLSGARYKNF